MNTIFVANEKSNRLAVIAAVTMIGACTFVGSFTMTGLVYSGITGQTYNVNLFQK